MSATFQPFSLAREQLKNRIVMSPMTRSRAGEGRTPTGLTVEYYVQRASAGLIVSEAIQPSPQGQGSPNTPGLHSPEQVQAWRKVTDAVHGAGGVIFAQLMHVGRIGRPEATADQPGNLHPVAPSGLQPRGVLYTPEGPMELGTPRELLATEIPGIVDDFASAARNAIEAGFDGVEIHGGYGYLVHQFLATGTNQRVDEWGGSVAGRVRFAVAVVEAVSAAIGAERTALRVSPGTTFNDIQESDVEETYTALVDGLASLGLAYLHVVESSPDDRRVTLELRSRFTGPLVLNPATEGPTDHKALHVIEDRTADLVSFGALFLANPDLPARLKAEGPYNEPDRNSYYGGGSAGYTDYPTLDRP